MSTFGKLPVLDANEFGFKLKPNVTRVCILNNFKVIEGSKSYLRKSYEDLFKSIISDGNFKVVYCESKYTDDMYLRCMMSSDAVKPKWINFYMEDGEKFNNHIPIDDDFEVDKERLAIAFYEVSKGDNHFTAFYFNEKITDIDSVIERIC